MQKMLFNHLVSTVQYTARDKEEINHNLKILTCEILHKTYKYKCAKLLSEASHLTDCISYSLPVDSSWRPGHVGVWLRGPPLLPDDVREVLPVLGREPLLRDGTHGQGGHLERGRGGASLGKVEGLASVGAQVPQSDSAQLERGV